MNRGLFVAAMAAGSFAGTPLAAAPSPYPLFVPLIARIKARLRARLRLPAILRYASSEALYATLDENTSTAYEIILIRDPKCYGVPECEVGRILSQPGTIAYDTSPANLRVSERVTLADGTAAIAGISAYRGQSVITWVERSRTYMLALYVRKYPADLLAMANSMTTY